MANYQGDNKTFRLTILDSDGDPPAGGTTGWTIVHVVKLDDDDTTEQIRKTSATASEIAPVPAPQNPDDNKWYIYYVPADTVSLSPCDYVRFTKVVTDTGKVHTILRDEWTLRAKGAV